MAPPVGSFRTGRRAPGSAVIVLGVCCPLLLKNAVFLRVPRISTPRGRNYFFCHASRYEYHSVCATASFTFRFMSGGF